MEWTKESGVILSHYFCVSDYEKASAKTYLFYGDGKTQVEASFIKVNL